MAEQDQQQQQQTGGTSGQQQPGQQQQQPPPPPDFDTWLKGQPDDVKGLLDGRLKSLSTALQSERQQREDFERKLREAAAKLDKGSEAQKSLEAMANGLQTQADFYDAAHQLGVNDLKLAYLAAQAGDMIDAKGRVNFDALKKTHPALFGAPASGPGRADGGTGKQPPAGNPMNDFIRRSAGR